MRSSLASSLAYEWVRLRTIRSTWWLTVLVVLTGSALAGLVSWGISASFGTPGAPRGGDLDLLAPLVVGQFAGEGAPYFLPYFMGMIGVFAWGHEYRHGMIRATLTALPSRGAAWVAKLLVVGAWVVGVTLLTLVLSALLGALWLVDDGISFATYDVARIMVKSTTYALLFTWLAMALAATIRNQTAALVLMFLWPLAVENIITLVLQLTPGLDGVAPLARFLPFNAGVRMLNVRDVTEPFFGDPLTPGAGFLVFGGFTVAFLVLSLVLFRRRDA